MTDVHVQTTAAGTTIAVVGDVYRFLATGKETDGHYAIWEALVPPGGGPPLHVHSREVEGFYILDGEIEFVADGKTIVGTPGMYVNIPIGVVHRFHNATDRPAGC